MLSFQTVSAFFLFCGLASASETVLIPGNPRGADALFPFTKGHLTGFLDVTGQIAIPAKFHNVGYFFEGLAPFEEEGLYGYADTNGNTAISPQYTEVTPFSEGLAAVRVGREWGYIDRTGALVVPPKYQAAGLMRDGLARVGTWARFKCFDNRRELSVDQAPEYMLGLPETLSYNGCVPDNPKFGFVNALGKLAIKQQYSSASDFSEGFASVQSAATGSLAGFIDTQGVLTVPIRFGSAFSFSNGLAPVSVDNQWGYVNAKSELVVKPQYGMALEFSEGLAAVFDQNQKWGYIDAKGKVAIEPRFESASSFSDGLAMVNEIEGGNSYFIDHQGNKANISFKALGSSSGGLSVVDNSGTQVYVNCKGKVIAALRDSEEKP